MKERGARVREGVKERERDRKAWKEIMVSATLLPLYTILSSFAFKNSHHNDHGCYRYHHFILQVV